MRNHITDLTRVTDEIETWHGDNAIALYLWHEYILQGKWESMREIVNALEFGHCAAGSFPGMIYTRDILDRLSDPDWQEAIESAFDAYAEATGETPDLARDGFHLESLVTFAVDWYSSELAGWLESRGKFYVAEIAVDSLDPSPDKVVFTSHDDMEDFLTEGGYDLELVKVEVE